MGILDYLDFLFIGLAICILYDMIRKYIMAIDNNATLIRGYRFRYRFFIFFFFVYVENHANF